MRFLKANNIPMGARWVSAVLLMALLLTSSCTAAGGRGKFISGISNDRAKAESDDVAGEAVEAAPVPLRDSDGIAGNASELELEELSSPGYAEGGPMLVTQDPFSLLPSDWLEQIVFHPQAVIAEIGDHGIAGHYAICFVSRTSATPMGIQNFHLSTLSEWETIEVTEYGSDGSDSLAEECTLIISAARPGLKVEVQTGTYDPEIYNSIEDKVRIGRIVGPNPLWVKIFYDFE